jgi:uncharacterized protein (TIGR00730 family)
VEEKELIQKIDELVVTSQWDINSLEAELIRQMILTSIKLTPGSCDTGQLKLMSRSLKEMKYAYHIFNQYPGLRRISMFGSARTKESHPDYLAAKDFAAMMALEGWMCITGAADGIMKAGLEGAKLSSSFGLAIQLPFESPSNSLIAGDPKQITFHYFFTRKLMFLSHSDAVAAFPGGFGTQDELFEVLTLMQTGKANIIPVVLIEGEKGYWEHWEVYIKEQLVSHGWINGEDQKFYYLAPSVEDAVNHVKRFYTRYHSSRYVHDMLIIRLLTPLSEKQIAMLNEEFASIIVSGKIFSTGSFPEEEDHLQYPRIAFKHTRKQFSLLRALIDRINEMD